MAFDIDARYAGGELVGPDGVSELAIARIAQRNVEDEGHAEEDDDGPPAGSDGGEALGKIADRLAVRIPVGDPARRHHHAERRDEGWDFG